VFPGVDVDAEEETGVEKDIGKFRQGGGEKQDDDQDYDSLTTDVGGAWAMFFEPFSIIFTL